MTRPRKRYFNGEYVFKALSGPKPREDSILGVCQECSQACWYTWLEKNFPDGPEYVAVLAVHVDELGFLKCEGSGKEPLGLGD